MKATDAWMLLSDACRYQRPCMWRITLDNAVVAMMLILVKNC